MDNICNPIGPLAVGISIGYRWRHQPDSSPVGPGCDRIGNKPGHWPTHRLERLDPVKATKASGRKASDAQIRERVDRLPHQKSYLRVRSFEFSHSVIESLTQTRVVMLLNVISFEQHLNFIRQRL